jgi:hypothetical protein
MRYFQGASSHASAYSFAGDKSEVDVDFLLCALLVADSILRFRRNSGGLVGGGEDDGALAVLEGHLAIVSVVLLTLEAIGTDHAVEGFLLGSGGGILAVLEDDLGDISTAQFNSWQ